VLWDPVRDYAPVSLLVTSPNVIVVHPSLPVKSLPQLIALAKARPGELNYSSGQTGASAHLAGELFKHMAGVNIVRIAYKGQGPAMVSLMSGETQLSFPNAAAVAPFLKSGKVVGLAVTASQPSALAPGLPTAAAAGLPGYESRAVLGMFVPARTPAAIVEQLAAEINRVLGSSEVKQRLFDTGSEAVAGAPSELAAAIRAETTITGKLIKALGIRAD
jgi:tripartite-type tricarboxylate transporter receptor subunit TctC